MSVFISDLIVRLVSDDDAGLWEVQAPFSYRSDLVGAVITVPVGFQTDFASVPRLPLIYDELGNTARKAGTVHDYLYTVQPYEREVADKLLREMMLAEGIAHWRAQAFYIAVRNFGGSHWKPVSSPSVPSVPSGQEGRA